MRDKWFPARRFLPVKDIDDSLSLLIALEHLAQMGGCEGFFEEKGMCFLPDVFFLSKRLTILFLC